MQSVIRVLFIAALAIGLFSGSAFAQFSAVEAVADRCIALRFADFSNVEDAPTQIVEVTSVGSEGTRYCQVKGYVASQIGFEIRLPDSWNGKYLQIGCAGHCGTLAAYRGGRGTCEDALKRGYACLLQDMGHRGTPLHALWGYNNLELKFDWGTRSTHVTSLAGKAITAQYYNQPPRKAYFMGCSTGGRQGLQEAQRFPSDFDGIVAGCPPVNLSKQYITLAWGWQVGRDQAGRSLFRNEDLKLLTATAIAQCDLDDGAADGVIGDPLNCDFDTSVLLCKRGQSVGCLTQEQITAAEKIYAGPMTSSGKRLYIGGPMPGSEYYVGVKDWRDAYDIGEGAPLGHADLAADGLKYLFFLSGAGPNWKLGDFDFDRDPKRLALMQAIYDSSDPDLRAFKEAGGKLLIYHAMNDAAVQPAPTVDYYETVERVMGGASKTQDFARLFLLPGGRHCFDAEVDWLTHLEAWVEEGQAPDKVIYANMDFDDIYLPVIPANASAIAGKRAEFPLNPAFVKSTRPAYPYPVRARYSGKGDVNDAASWVPVRRR